MKLKLSEDITKIIDNITQLNVVKRKTAIMGKGSRTPRMPDRLLLVVMQHP